TANTPWVTGGLMSKADNPEEELRQLNARQPHGRLVEPAEVARTIAFLASPFQGSTTGSTLAVDGGMQGLRRRAEEATNHAEASAGWVTISHPQPPRRFPP